MMSNIKKHPIWFWGFIVLLVLNISATTAMLIASKRIHNNIEYRNYHKRVSIINNDNVKVRRKAKEKAWKDLNFTKEQKLFLKSARKKHIDKMRILKGQLKTMQSKLFNQLAKGKNDNIKALKDDILVIHQEILEENMDFYESLKSKLSEEQMQAIKAHIDRQFRVKDDVPGFKRNPHITPPPHQPL